MTKLRAISPGDWKHIMNAYKKFVVSSGAESASEKLLSNFKVENRQVIAPLPYRWLIATKSGWRN